ncbi:DUF6950 family protein [Tautonia plasticadhaerens]|uniref:DUF6950 domain-containing protein n=1 Tax=Tautonia plasticadhaerens TaxID=2527974 RepID=A0A518H238_9BACT|nr:hypothetical protein [Tautonia plasticadhaerens]QDV34894.1 hypothetical protein ElP_27910 [Tautonia plasticadhaerens]
MQGNRKPGWESLLGEYLHASASKPFAWGSHDCALYAATWVLLATGSDHVSRWKGDYATEFGARRAMIDRGFETVEDIADHHLEEKPVTVAMRGDLVLHPQGALGICNGLFSHFVTPQGLCVEETLACLKAWGV